MAGSLKTFRKQPAEIKDVDWNLDSFLDTPTTSGDYVASATVTVVSGNTGGAGDLVLGPGTLPDLQILAGKTSGIAGQRIKVWFGAGTNGITYKLTVIATLNSGRVEEKDFQVRVQEI